MKFNTYELSGFAACVMLMAAVLWLLQVENAPLELSSSEQQNQAANIISVPGDSEADLRSALREGANARGQVQQLIVDDVLIGTGPVVEEGDRVTVHYIGRLQNGTEFDNSRDRGTPFTFTVGEERVIEGWEQGIVGMQAGGQRILVIPSELGYGDERFGPIPANSTLVFAIELLSIEE